MPAAFQFGIMVGREKKSIGLEMPVFECPAFSSSLKFEHLAQLIPRTLGKMRISAREAGTLCSGIMKYAEFTAPGLTSSISMVKTSMPGRPALTKEVDLSLGKNYQSLLNINTVSRSGILERTGACCALICSIAWKDQSLIRLLEADVAETKREMKVDFKAGSSKAGSVHRTAKRSAEKDFSKNDGKPTKKNKKEKKKVKESKMSRRKLSRNTT